MKNEEIRYYVAECMEFSILGKYIDNIETISEAVKIYNSIPDERMNAGKGIGFTLYKDEKFSSSFDLLSNDVIDMETINSIKEFKNNDLVQKALKGISKIFPEKVKKG